MIPFNKPHVTGKEFQYIQQAIIGGKISGNGVFSQKCHRFFENRYQMDKVLLTTSCTDALEMSALLTEIRPGDEVIIPSYTFVSTANAFVLRGANVIFADSEENTPNIDAEKLEPLITEKTRAIVIVHYAGVACNMAKILDIAEKYKLVVIEDAAQAIESFYRKQPLGTFGHLAAFSFHETKNIISGEGGLLVINDEKYKARAEIIWEKGTNRAAFWRGEVKKYHWVDIGSSFLPSELTTAFLFAQLENLETIQSKRIALWQYYYHELESLAQEGHITIPHIPEYATNNGHLFYILCRDIEQRDQLIAHLKQQEIHAVFHYLALHTSPYYKGKYQGGPLPNAQRYSECLLRLPLFYQLSTEQQCHIVKSIKNFYKK